MLGAGATMAGQGTVKLASVGRIASVAPAPAADPRLLNYRHVLDGLWYPGTASKYAASAYQWLRDALGPQTSFEGMSSAAAGSTLGAGGLIFLPHLGGQWAPHWDPSRLGAFVGIDTGHTHGDLCRAAMEGVAFGLREAMAHARGAGLQFDELRLLGGGSTSALWSQILADVLSTPLLVPRQRSAAWGMAVLCGVAAGFFPRDAAGLRSMMAVEARFEPQADRAAAYGALHDVYRAADAALAPVSRQLGRWRASRTAPTEQAHA
jgi:xylulokinase